METRRNTLTVVMMMMAAIGLAPGEARAATITWIDGPTTVTTVDQINLDGTLVHAGTWGSAEQSVSVGTETIVFEDRPVNTTDGEAGATATTAWWGEYSDANVYVGDTGSAAFNTVLDSFADDAPNPMEVTIQGLTPGDTYQIQLFTSDDRSCCGGRTQKWSDQQADGGPNETPVFVHNQSVYFTGLFEADATEQLIYGRGVSGANNIVNAYVLRRQDIIPEPATLALLGLAACGLGGYVRRRRKA